MKTYPSEEERFWAKVIKTDSCWVWQGITCNGYGRITRWGKKHVFAHRYSWELAHGPIAPGMTIDHLCRNRPCVNPAHMEVVSRGENSRRGMGPSGINTRKTHCIRGHDLANAIITQEGFRRCRACNRLKDRYRRLTGHAVIPKDWAMPADMADTLAAFDEYVGKQ